MELVSQRIETQIGELLVAATDSGLCRISFPVELSGKWFPWFDRYFSVVPKTGTHRLFDELREELGEYLTRKRSEFDLPLDLRGTSFQLKVWKRLLSNEETYWRRLEVWLDPTWLT